MAIENPYAKGAKREREREIAESKPSLQVPVRIDRAPYVEATLLDEEEAPEVSATVQMSRPLDTLDACEERLEKLNALAHQAAVERGRIFRHIRDSGLYKSAAKTFEEYCRKRHDLSRQRAYQLIALAQPQAALPAGTSGNGTKPRKAKEPKRCPHCGELL